MTSSTVLNSINNQTVYAHWEIAELTYNVITNNYQCGTTATDKLINYSGNCQVIDDGNGDWRIKFTSSGTLTTPINMTVDIFAVGGGGGGKSGGGGGGYTATYPSVSLVASTYDISVGSGGAASKDGSISYFGSATTYFANGGKGSTGAGGGAGGSGGGAHGCQYCSSPGYDCTDSCCGIGKRADSSGARFGANASSPSSGSCFYDLSGSGGKGQGTTTCEFGQGTTTGCDAGVTEYSKGGIGTTALNNSGNGGNVNAAGSSGVVIIRNKR